MHVLWRMLSRLIAVGTHRRDDGDLEQEMETHRALLIEEYLRRGMSGDEARRAAHVTLGNAAQLREAHREMRAVPLLEEVVRDVAYAWRGFRRQPAFTAVAVITLAIGIGANAAVFSIVHGVLMRPLAYEDPDALVSVTRSGERVPGQAPAASWISLRRWESMRDARTLEIGVYRPAFEDAILGGREPVVLRAARMSANVTEILGVRPIVGRPFRAEEDAEGSAPVTLISERLWDRQFGRAPSIVGSTITLGSAPYTVVGILPAGFHFPDRDIDLWLPGPSSTAFIDKQYWACCTPLMGVARIRAGFTRAQADAEVAVLNARYQPAGQRRVDGGAAVLMPLKDGLVDRVHTMLWMLMAAVGFVLLIACANVATLLMARATSRTREFAVRSALGAGRWRVIRQLITESLMLSTLGGVLGLVIAYAGVRAVATMTLFDLPRAHELSVDGTVLLWTMAMACATGVVFGTFPSVQLLKPSLINRLRQSGATEAAPDSLRGIRIGARGALVVTQVALSLILLIGAVLMGQTITRLTHVDMGFPSAGLLTMRVPLPVATYNTAEKRARFFDELVTRVQAIPGVRGATIVRALPTTGGLGTNLQIESQRIEDPGRLGQMVNTVLPGYFEVLGQRVTQGRSFEARDNVAGAAGVVIVNEAFARKYWPAYPKTTPIGDRLQIPVVTMTWLEVVGVVADVKHGGPTREADLQVYIPDRLYPPQVAFLALRAEGDPMRAVDAIRAAVRAIDPNQSVTDIRMMDEILETATGQQHLAARVLGLFAATGVLLAVIGLYGVMAYSSTRRAPDTGDRPVRRALGAGHGDVVWMVVGQGLRVTCIGLVCGVAGAYASTRLLQSLLFEVSTTDATTFVVAPVLFVVVTVLREPDTCGARRPHRSGRRATHVNVPARDSASAAGSVSPSASACNIRRALAPSKSETRLESLRCACSSSASKRLRSWTRLRVSWYLVRVSVRHRRCAGSGTKLKTSSCAPSASPAAPRPVAFAPRPRFDCACASAGCPPAPAPRHAAARVAPTHVPGSLRGRFHHHFLDLLRDEPRSMRAPPREPPPLESLAAPFDVRNDDGEHPLVHVDPGDLVRHVGSVSPEWTACLQVHSRVTGSRGPAPRQRNRTDVRRLPSHRQPSGPLHRHNARSG